MCSSHFNLMPVFFLCVSEIFVIMIIIRNHFHCAFSGEISDI